MPKYFKHICADIFEKHDIWGHRNNAIVQQNVENEGGDIDASSWS